jgi:hypothetical protein
MPQSGAMLDPSKRPDLATLLDTGTPAEAMSTIADEFGRLGAADHARFREELVASVEARLARSEPRKAEWFAPLVASSVLHASAREAASLPAEATPVEARLQRLLLACLDAMQPEERGACLASSARDAPDISVLCALLTAVERERDSFLPDAALADVRKVLLARIAGLAATSAFWAQRFPAVLLWFWFAHGEEQRVYLFTGRAMEDPIGLAALLTIPIERIGTGADAQEVVAARRWSRIIDFQALEARAVALAMSAPARADRSRARRFLDAFGAGKSELFR